MASKNQVTLTFAGDHEKLEKSFDAVGASAKGMADKVDRASDDMSSGFDRAGSGFDTLDDKAGRAEAGFRGTMDVMAGAGELAKGNVLQGLTDLGGGVSSLAQGFGGILVPALQRTIGFLAQTRVGMLAQAAASKVVGAATKVWTGIQAAFNVVMALNPVVLITLAIIALIAIIVLIATKTDFFQKLWHKIWAVIGDPVKAVWKWIRETLWPGIQMVFDGIVAVARLVWEGIKKYFGFWQGMLARVLGWVSGLWTGAKNRLGNLIDFVRGLPRRIIRALGNVGRMLFNAGRNIIGGLIDGIGSMIQKVRDTISNVAQTVRDFLPFSPARRGPLSGSGSPFLAGRAIGSMVAEGIGSSASRVSRASSKMAAAAAEMLAAIRSGKTFFEDFSFRGGSANVDRFNSAIAGRFAASGGSFDSRSDVTGFLGRLAAGGGRTVIEVRSGGSRLDDALVEILARAVRVRGGNVQLVLGRG